MTITGRTGTLAWHALGSELKRPLLMIHALGVDSRMWEQQLEELSKVRRLVMVDLPGHGRSHAAPGPYTVADLGRDLLEVATAVEADQFDVCGASLGGLISLWLAGNAPERVSGLIASNTAARIGTEEIWQARIEAVRDGGIPAVASQALERFFTRDFATTYPGMFERTSQVLLGTDPEAYMACCTALRDADVSESVEVIGCPTLVIGGGEDISTPPEQSLWLHEHIAGSDLVILEGAPHFANVEQAEPWTAAATNFLAGQGDPET